QAEALSLLAEGCNVLTVTPTASGKSLIYVIPALEAIAADPAGHALFLFPYKALEQDQLASLKSFIASAGLEETVTASIYDGDTPQTERRKIRAHPPGILITNPDMLHMGLLAYHAGWRSFFERLKLVVVDELHVYRGIFGSHFHHLMRRLARVCRSYGSNPRFIVSSATIGNPEAFSTSLLGAPFTVIETSGAPRSGQHFLFVNPSSGSPYTAATFLLEKCLREGYRTIVFTKARKITELLTSWLAGTAPDLMTRVSSYRAGYLPEERRRIEERLSSGDLLGVISTSALEHGIDIGGLDVCILVGYPGSITSSWQRAGRVGRSDRESLVVLVALPDALDQYFMTNPAEFFERGFEHAAVDTANPVIAGQHLVCAGAEIPITQADKEHYAPAAFALVETLAKDGGLVADAGGQAWYSLRRNPQRDVNLRATGNGYTIADADTGRTIGTVDGVRAYVECHEGAIYLHQAQQFEVVELDREHRRITARRVERDYYTQVLSEKETEILEVLATRQLTGYKASLGRLRVTQEFKEYVRKRISDQQKMSSHPLDLPPLVYETVGLWWEIPESVRAEAERREHHFMGSIHASEHAAISLFPLLTICDRGDIGGISYPAHPQTGGSTVFIYDGYPGGIGLAAAGYERIEALLGRTLQTLVTCDCEEGCPSCIHSPKCGSGNHPLDKAGARFVLESLVAATNQGPPKEIPAKRGATLRAAPLPAVPEPPTTPSPARLLFFDLETRRSAEEVGGWGRIHEMGLALAVIYDESEGAYRTYFEADVDRLIADLLAADRVVGFNVKRFDYTVLRGYRDAAYEQIPTCDLLEEIHRRLGFRLRLNHLAEETLHEGKSADGLQSLRWFKEGRMDLIEEYCKKDVEVTRRLYHFGRENGYLLYRDHAGRPVRVTVGW
ncbi:MAG TPA: DEAD/DEAH box helicase, partial [Candidatus Polarisedimenticolia bacterium]|nr:DEAD/DEAH box helicase [Candidatus Polarisedimenticolia bacterium]